MIFVLIAGTYTPFCLLVLQGTLATAVLIAVWAGAALGVATKSTGPTCTCCRGSCTSGSGGSWW